jgi:hypothetical protein
MTAWRLGSLGELWGLVQVELSKVSFERIPTGGCFENQ